MSEEVEVKLENVEEKSDVEVDSRKVVFKTKPRKNLRQRKPSNSDDEDKPEEDMYVEKFTIRNQNIQFFNF